MNRDVSPDLLDCPTAYGFVVSLLRSRAQDALTLNRIDDGDVSQVITDGLTIIARSYPSTPEATSETQPIVTPNVILVYEGRIDNRGEIAYALGMPQLAQQPDGSVLAAAYDAWGAELSAKAIGEYAYAVFDRHSRQVVAGQDSLGIRRLFYGAIGGRFVITSNLRLFFQRFPGLRPPYDREVLREYFTGTMVPWSGRTIWRGINELGRGQALVEQGKQFNPKTVWQPNPRAGERFESEEEVDEVFRKHLFDAVRAALRSPGPLLCDLSGGYDSSTVCCAASLLIQSGESRGPIIGWSFVSNRSNESTFQDAVRQQCLIDSHTLNFTKHLPFQCFPDSEIPLGSFVLVGAVNRATREFARTRGILSRLTGQGGDALLQKGGGGAPVYLADWFREGRMRDWYRHFVAYLQGGSYNAWQLLRHCTVGTLDLHAGWHAPMPVWVTPQFQKEIREARHDFLHSYSRAFRSDARERMYRWTLCFIPYPGGSLPEHRVPLAHRPLVEFLLGLEWNYLMKPNSERLLMRRSLHRVLPETVLSGQRCTTSFSASLYEGLRAAWPRISHFVTGQQLAELGVVEHKQFQAAVDGMRAGYEGANPAVAKTALYLETWLGLKALLANNRVCTQAIESRRSLD